MTGDAAGSAALADIPRELVGRFAAGIARLRFGGRRLGLAVSGGPDSMAMLLLAEAAIPGHFEVAAVDHGLRPEAADECAMVAQLCAALGVRCEVLQVTVGPGNVQQMARRARYSALAEWAGRQGLSAICTAHHADDQAETLLMRLNRGSGVSGLAGVREAGSIGGHSKLPVLRPVLSFRRADLRTVVERAGIIPATDPSNADARFDRVRIRQALADADWIDPVALAASASHLADAEEALAAFAAQLWSAAVSHERGVLRMQPPALREMRLRLAGRAIRELGREPRGSDLARIVDRLDRGEGGNVAGVLVTVEGNDWVFRPEPPRRS